MAGLVSVPRKVEEIRMACHIEYSLNGKTIFVFLVPVGVFKLLYVCAQKLTAVHQHTYKKGFTLNEDCRRNHLSCGLVNSFGF